MVTVVVTELVREVVTEQVVVTSTPSLATPIPAETLPLPTKTAVLPIGTPDYSQPGDLVQAFQQAPYRVIAVVDNPNYAYTLIVATDRGEVGCGSADAPVRCTNDATCGSLYTSPVCYFFFEPKFIADTFPYPQFVGEWQGGLDALLVESLTVSDSGLIRFESAGGDAGCGVQASWEIDTATRQVTNLLEQQTCIETDE